MKKIIAIIAPIRKLSFIVKIFLTISFIEHRGMILRDGICICSELCLGTQLDGYFHTFHNTRNFIVFKTFKPEMNDPIQITNWKLKYFQLDNIVNV